MAQKKYCGHCGHPNEYKNGVAPTTCQSCHKAIGSVFKVQPAPVPTKKVMAREIENSEELEEDEEFYGEIIVPRKFEYEINVPKRMTVRDLANGEQVQGGVNPNLRSADFE